MDPTAVLLTITGGGVFLALLVIWDIRWHVDSYAHIKELEIENARLHQRIEDFDRFESTGVTR